MIIYSNIKFEKWLGYCKKDLEGNNVDILLNNELSSIHSQFIGKYKETKVSHIIGKPRKVMIKKKDGR
jgi:PAS domain S-box-containing protein